MRLKLRQSLDNTGSFYQELVFKIGDADGELFWNGYLENWMVGANLVNG
ncbi:MAG: hypothetical protein KME55_33170 [Nostoc indistinguendum CM1-VF10]|nr:hypothetical protein [Nostoc indistinguendum CM1-VF10]